MHKPATNLNIDADRKLIECKAFDCATAWKCATSSTGQQIVKGTCPNEGQYITLTKYHQASIAINDSLEVIINNNDVKAKISCIINKQHSKNIYGNKQTN